MKYYIDCDQDCYWFVIPENKRDEWRLFLDEQDAEYNEGNYVAPPEWAKHVGEDLCKVTFDKYEIE